jgi:syntaxin 18
MDQTELFRATVRTLKLRRKKQGAASPPPSSLSSDSRRSSSLFESSARDVVVFISKLQAFLLRHRKSYINSAKHLVGGSSSMTDSERDEIDAEAQKFIQLSRDRINSLQKHLNDNLSGEQVHQYRHAVYESLQEYLRRVAKLYSEQRAIRVKRIVDRKRTSRLQPERYRRLLGSSARTSSNLASYPTTIDREPSPTQPLNTDDANSVSGDEGRGDCGDDGDSGEMGGSGEMGSDLVAVASEETSGSSVRYRGRAGTGESERWLGGNDGFSGSLPVVSGGPSLTEEEEAEFAQENEQLFEHVSTMVDEVRQIEGKVIEISKLQELFSQKVLVQAEQIDNISRVTVETAENVIEGNEQIKGAIKNRASLRVWILFVLIVLSFTLLFLDWYS